MAGPIAGNESLILAVMLPISAFIIGSVIFFAVSSGAALKLRIARTSLPVMGLLCILLDLLIAGISIFSAFFVLTTAGIFFVIARAFAICPACGVAVMGGTAGSGFSSPKYCSGCGSSLPEATVNCPACGALVKSSQTTVTPTSVSWESGPVSLLSRRPFCPNCGAVVTFLFGSPPERPRQDFSPH